MLEAADNHTAEEDENNTKSTATAAELADLIKGVHADLRRIYLRGRFFVHTQHVSRLLKLT